MTLLSTLITATLKEFPFSRERAHYLAKGALECVGAEAPIDTYLGYIYETDQIEEAQLEADRDANQDYYQDEIRIKEALYGN